jgi:hypothetical protein
VFEFQPGPLGIEVQLKNGKVRRGGDEPSDIYHNIIIITSLTVIHSTLRMYVCMCPPPLQLCCASLFPDSQAEAHCSLKDAEPLSINGNRVV